MARRRTPLPPIDLSGRDDQATREVAEILKELPEAHPARQALRDSRPTIDITHLVPGRQDLIDALMRSYWAHSARLAARRGPDTLRYPDSRR